MIHSHLINATTERDIINLDIAQVLEKGKKGFREICQDYIKKYA